MGSPQYLRVRNWEKFQHYKDRQPPWIKLHVSLIDDYEFTVLPDQIKYQLMGIWMLAAKTDNKIPVDAKWIRDKIGVKGKLNLDVLLAAGFLEPWSDSGQEEKWASRYVSSALREEIMRRDNRQCRECGATRYLEIDHILPISHGGTGEASNLQVLCRSHNRAKRNRLARDSAEQLATQTIDRAEHQSFLDRGRDREETEAQELSEKASVEKSVERSLRVIA
jgi:hypothetical protein